ncbi:MAG: hypothetical protein KAY66_04590, partial [Neisseria sp.]|nr:hypothetical protein [Neisseria sp.]
NKTPAFLVASDEAKQKSLFLCLYMNLILKQEKPQCKGKKLFLCLLRSLSHSNSFKMTDKSRPAAAG